MSTVMHRNNTANESEAYFTRCLGTYYLLTRPTGQTFNTYISVIIALSIYSLFSALGNGLIIYVYIKQKSLQSTNTLLLVCLAFLDFVSAVVLEPLYVVRLLSEIFGFTSCVYILIVRRLLEYLRPASFMTLALITIERYLALFKAITHRRMATKRRLLYVVLLIWFVWFLVIFIRSFFPKITTAFYTFFTLVAFSLLVGNLIMYFKIGKLARLHSRPTRVSTVPGSLSVGSRDPGSLTVGCDKSLRRGSNNSSVAYSKKAESVNDVGNAKIRGSTKVATHSLESGVKSTKINVQSIANEKLDALIESNVLSTQNEKFNTSGNEVGGGNNEGVQAADLELCENATAITTSDKLVANNSENDDGNNSKRKVNDKETNMKRETVTSSRSDNTISTSNMSIPMLICKPECSDVKTYQVKTVTNNNATNTDYAQESSCREIFQSTNIQQGNAEHKEVKKNTSDSSANHKAADKNVHEASNLEEAIEGKDKPSIQFKNTESSNTNSKAVTKTNKDTKQKTSRVKFKNTENLTVESRERNATWTVFYIVAILTLCYLPISALLLYLSFKQEPDATSLFIYVPIADTIALFNALVNPFIYCYKNRKMRVAVKNVLQKTRST